MHSASHANMRRTADIVKGNGTGSPESIYGGAFEDEDLERPVDAEGLLCMANKGPDTNGSQYFITLKESPHLNGTLSFAYCATLT